MTVIIASLAGIALFVGIVGFRCYRNARPSIGSSCADWQNEIPR